ncbi:hypothetical protein N7466_003259 [Penicillium verhagenii]|uniref:uncharacterized protein n=1 Tax=Penicillium verhagenii TaxID=1562060 RepID=UPI002545312E|nr:uncharacterized protein N7466_003259 [Penicillium verhagenii]KAJ5936809.1 hypothetical protein N7466_003259 [Penicillium verhagenii]
MLRPKFWPRALQALFKPPRLSTPQHPFSTTSISPEKALPPRLKLNDADLTISYLKGTGPGGQKINKTNSAVQIIHHPSGIVVKCQATRSRSQNAKTARLLLADKIEQREKGDESRSALKVQAARKKKASKMKKTRRKYRDLEDKEGEELELGEDGADADAHVDADARSEGAAGSHGQSEVSIQDKGSTSQRTP